jgi:GT2 family glycosyltransferase
VLHVGVLTYNGLAHTQRCLASLVQHTRAPWRALVRDNASSDDTPEWLRTIAEPRITVHCADDNLGVGGGRNWLLEQLLPSMRDDDLIVLLDNDIELFAGWEQPFLAAFAAHPRLGVAGRWAFSMLVHESFRDILAENGRADGPVDTVQGCTFVIRAAAARDIGLFDVALGRFWHEDDDYSIRALANGWDVRRVDTDAIVHHEHGSGIALRPDKVIGSARNQVYLTRKWRELGVIDELGVPRRPVAEDHAPLLAQLRTLIGRPVLRTELNSAIVDATLLLHGDVSDARAATLATPVTRVLLDKAVAPGSADAPKADAAKARIARVLAERRRTAPVDDGARDAPSPRVDTSTVDTTTVDTTTVDTTPPVGATSPAPINRRVFGAICTPDAWDDVRWAASTRDGLHDGSGRDYYARSETLWRDGQLLLALRTMGLLRRATKVLLVGHPSERLIAALTHHVGSIVVRDVEVHPPDALRDHAPQLLGTAILTPGPIFDGTSRAPAEPYDLVLCPNASRYAPASGFPALLTRLAAHLAPTGTLGVGVSVRVSGPADGRWVEPALLADDAALLRAGVRRIGRFEAHVSDGTLLGAAPDDAHAAVRPRLARATGAHVVTQATLVARRA